MQSVSLDPETLISLRTQLLDWFSVHQREMPWRSLPSPYRTLVSEVMLQQTRVDTVLNYYARWMTSFPTLSALAEAPIDMVLQHWSGLGYYRRAHNLHRAAKQIVELHDGAFPENFQDILALPGVGRYTAGAIASIAFQQRAPLVDGNVARVLCRLFALEGDPTRGATQKTLWRRAEELLSPKFPGDFNQGMMELGALVCTRSKPNCTVCPWAPHCKARSTGRQASLPTPKKRPTRRQVIAGGLLLTSKESPTQVFLVQRPFEGLWSGLWEIPTLELERRDLPKKPGGKKAVSTLSKGALGAKAKAQMERFAEDLLGLKVVLDRPLTPIQHTLTHLDWTLIPWRAEVDAAQLRAIQLQDQRYQKTALLSQCAPEGFGIAKLTSELLGKVLNDVPESTKGPQRLEGLLDL